MRVVLDANVVVAAFAARGLCEAVVELCLTDHEMFWSEALLSEIDRNLRRKVKLPSRDVAEVTSLLRENGVLVIPAKVSPEACRDPQDLHVLGLVQACGAECLITGDRDLVDLKHFKKCRIVTPRQFADLLRK